MIVLGFLNFRDEIYEKAIKYFELATKVQPNAFIAEIQFGRCYQKLGNNREAYKIFRRIHNKYPDNKEALSNLIAACRELNLPYDEYHQRMREIDDEILRSGGSNIVYGMPPDEGTSSNDNQKYSYSGNNSYSNPNYQGEMLDFISNKKQAVNTNPKQNYLKFQASPDEILP